MYNGECVNLEDKRNVLHPGVTGVIVFLIWLEHISRPLGLPDSMVSKIEKGFIENGAQSDVSNLGSIEVELATATRPARRKYGASSECQDTINWDTELTPPSFHCYSWVC